MRAANLELCGSLLAIAMKQCEQKKRRSLTCSAIDREMPLPGRILPRASADLRTHSDLGDNALQTRFHNVYARLHFIAGALLGLVSESISELQQPTRHPARWVFNFLRPLIVFQP